MDASAEHIFAIRLTVSGVCFELGYCEGWLRRDERILLRQPFTRCSVLVMEREIFYRGPWPRPPFLRAEHHSLDLVPRELWMLITHEDLLAAAAALRECASELDPSGFRRLA